MIGARNRIVKENHDTVPRETLEGSIEVKNKFAHRGMIAAQYFHDFFRFGAIRKRSEAAQVEEDDGNFTAVTFKKIFIFPKDRFGDLRGQVALEPVHALQFVDLLFNLLTQRAIPFI